MSGYMDKKSRRFYRDWSEKFFVLTNIGLIYFNDPNDKPVNLFPVIDCTTSPLPFTTHKKNFAFMMRAGRREIILAARNKKDYD